MNRTLPFGMHNLGCSYAIKINVKLTKKDAVDIAKTFYNQLYVISIERGSYDKDICLHRIEGSIPHKDMAPFIIKLELAKEFRKIAESEAKISGILESQIPVNFPEIPDSLPFEI
jgi:hypothetical protein